MPILRFIFFLSGKGELWHNISCCLDSTIIVESKQQNFTIIVKFCCLDSAVEICPGNVFTARIQIQNVSMENWSTYTPVFRKWREHIHHKVADVHVVIIIPLPWNHHGFIQNSVIEKRKPKHVANNRRIWCTCSKYSHKLLLSHQNRKSEVLNKL